MTPERAHAAPIGGVCPVLATPFDAAGAADTHALERIVEFALRCGADAIVYPGVASEVEQLDEAERDQLLDAVSHALRDRVPLIVGASAADSATTIRHLSQFIAVARLAGEQGIGVIPHATIGAGIFHAASLHGAASLPDVPFHEHQHSVFDANLRFVDTRMRCHNGFFELPDGPGLGVTPAPGLWAHVVTG